jgi:hypothetical protein
MTDPQRPSDATKAAERAEAETRAGADRMPTEDEENVAEQQSIDDNVREHEKDMAERGAHQEGEGRIP